MKQKNFNAKETLKEIKPNNRLKEAVKSDKYVKFENSKTGLKWLNN